MIAEPRNLAGRESSKCQIVLYANCWPKAMLTSQSMYSRTGYSQQCIFTLIIGLATASSHYFLLSRKKKQLWLTSYSSKRNVHLEVSFIRLPPPKGTIHLYTRIWNASSESQFHEIVSWNYPPSGLLGHFRFWNTLLGESGNPDFEAHFSRGYLRFWNTLLGEFQTLKHTWGFMKRWVQRIGNMAFWLTCRPFSADTR